jgi:hypothetical protein
MSNSQLTRRLDVPGRTCRLDQLKPFLPSHLFQNIIINDEGCWEWTANTMEQGYVTFRVGSKVWLFHRFSYTKLIAPIPPRLILDHRCHTHLICEGGSTCRHRRCGNPEHVKPTTHHENNSRGNRAMIAQTRTMCFKGLHEMTEKNTRVDTRGSKVCKACDAAQARLRRANG